MKLFLSQKKNIFYIAIEQTIPNIKQKFILYYLQKNDQLKNYIYFFK